MNLNLEVAVFRCICNDKNQWRRAMGREYIDFVMAKTKTSAYASVWRLPLRNFSSHSSDSRGEVELDTKNIESQAQLFPGHNYSQIIYAIRVYVRLLTPPPCLRHAFKCADLDYSRQHESSTPLHWSSFSMACPTHWWNPSCVYRDGPLFTGSPGSFLRLSKVCSHCFLASLLHLPISRMTTQYRFVKFVKVGLLVIGPHSLHRW